jgi:serine/threonine-protein kinase HipA
LAGVEIPEIKLVEMSKLDNLPPINLPHELYAFGIKRFDRDNQRGIHSEDFAQVLVKYPHEKTMPPTKPIFPGERLSLILMTQY